MSGSNFIHGIVLVGAMVALGLATTPLEQIIGFKGVVKAKRNHGADKRHSVDEVRAAHERRVENDRDPADDET